MIRVFLSNYECSNCEHLQILFKRKMIKSGVTYLSFVANLERKI